jgi:hypothetical protein
MRLHPWVKLLYLFKREAVVALHKINIYFTRRAAAPLDNIAVAFYKRGGHSLSHKINISFTRGAAATLHKIAVPLYKRGGHSLT